MGMVRFGKNLLLAAALGISIPAMAGAKQAATHGASSVALDVPDKDKLAYLKDGGHYVPAAELKARNDVPKGRIVAGELRASKVFPGMPHKFWVYVPAQYHEGSLACLMVILDGSTFLSGEVPMPILMDNLIADGTIPVMIGVFTDAGPIGPGYPIYGGTGNRAIEYDSVSPNLSKFLAEELIPKATRSYKINPDPACHGIMGESSGGSAAFGVAWYRSDVFGKVLSVVGSFTAIRGADAFPAMVRQHDRKPIRVFLEDGSNDLDTIFGDWPLANKQMAAALAYRSYDYRFEFGQNGHNDHHFASIAGDAMRWLWRR